MAASILLLLKIAAMTQNVLLNPKSFLSGKDIKNALTEMKKLKK